jgi:MFS family permease
MTSGPAVTASQAGGLPHVRAGRGYSWYVLAVLGLVSLANYYDRNLISILVEPLKRDLHLSDSQIGLLTGFAFALAYGVFGIPVARLADRYGRVRILSISVALWSVMTALTARTVGFVSMALARAGVAIGEAGGLPPTHALVAEYFEPERRGRALSLMGVCGGLGFTFAYAGGGLINDWRGWRVAFLLSGIPGLLVAVLLACTVREPPRPSPPQSATGAAEPMSLREVSAILWRRRAFVHLCVGLGIAAIGAYAQAAWSPAFLMRVYHMSAARVGSFYSLVAGPATLLSIFAGGALNDWLVRRDKRGPFWILALSFGSIVPASFVLFLVHNFALNMALSFIVTVLAGLWVGPSYALVQSLAGPRLRAVAAAIFMMLVNVVSLGLGPYLTGVLSDALTPRFGTDALTVSLCVMTLTCGIGVVNFLLATRTAAVDMDEAEGSG